MYISYIISIEKCESEHAIVNRFIMNWEDSRPKRVIIVSLSEAALLGRFLR